MSLVSQERLVSHKFNCKLCYLLLTLLREPRVTSFYQLNRVAGEMLGRMIKFDAARQYQGYTDEQSTNKKVSHFVPMIVMVLMASRSSATCFAVETSTFAPVT